MVLPMRGACDGPKSLSYAISSICPMSCDGEHLDYLSVTRRAKSAAIPRAGIRRRRRSPTVIVAPTNKNKTIANRNQNPRSRTALRNQARQPVITVVLPFLVMTYLCKMELPTAKIKGSSADVPRPPRSPYTKCIRAGDQLQR